MSKTPDYVKDAVKNYRKKFDIVQARLDKGTIDRIKALGLNTNQFINSLVSSELDKLERGEKTIYQMSEEDISKILESELKFDQTDELKNWMRGFVYNGEKQPLFDFIEM